MDINGVKATIFDIMSFLKFHDKIRDKHPREFKLLYKEKPAERS